VEVRRLTRDFQLKSPANQLCFGEDGSFAPDLDDDMAGEIGAKETVANVREKDLSKKKSEEREVQGTHVSSS
jgi:hypothetical protein